MTTIKIIKKITHFLIVIVVDSSSKLDANTCFERYFQCLITAFNAKTSIKR